MTNTVFGLIVQQAVAQLVSARITSQIDDRHRIYGIRPLLGEVHL